MRRLPVHFLLLLTLHPAGDGITVYGFSNASYAILLDGAVITRGTSLSSSSNVLFNSNNLPTSGAHNITVLVQSDGRVNNSFLALDRAIVRHGPPGRYAPGTSSMMSAQRPPCYRSSNLINVVVDNQNTSALVYSGTWNHTYSNPQIHGGQPISTTSGDAGASVTYTFNNSDAVAINGTTDFGAGTYTVVRSLG
jgi:hypothetical protein